MEGLAVMADARPSHQRTRRESRMAPRLKRAGWANWIEVSPPDVCAAGWRVTAVLFPIRINYYLMHVKRQDALAGKSEVRF
jgi:hypothetical protein